MKLPRYPKYKDSGVKWLGQVPEHWEIKRLKRCIRLVSKRATEQTYPVALENLESWTGKYIPLDSAYEAEGIAFECGDILFGKLRPYLAKAYLATTAGEAVGDFFVMRPNGSVRSDFLQHFVLTKNTIDIIDGSTYGAKMPRASWDFLGSIPVPVPCSDEQDSICRFVRIETAKIDVLVCEQQRLIELLKEKRQAIISHAVTKGLNPDVPMRPSGISWIGDIPNNWIVLPIRFVAKLESGHTPSRSHPEYWEDCTIPWFTLADIWQIREAGRDFVTETAEMVSDIGLANSSARLLPKDTVMLSRTASVGFSAIMGCDMATSQDFANWICGQRLQPEFLLLVFRAMTNEFNRLKFGSTHNTIYMPDIRSFRTALPPIEEQSHIVATTQSRLSEMDDMIAEAVHIVELLQERRSALISAAVTGQIDVRNCRAEEAVVVCQ